MEFEDLRIQTRSGMTRYATICPQCNETRERHKGAKCLTVNDEVGNRWYKCNHPPCGWSGNLDAQDRYEEVFKKSKIPNTQKVFSSKVNSYFKKRGISMNTAKESKVYETTRGPATIIGFPFYMNITLVNVKFLDMDWKQGSKYPKWTQLPKAIGTRIIPFGMQSLRLYDEQGGKFKDNICIITEGEWDMLTWKECGYVNVISVPQGAPSLTSKNFDTEFAYLQDKYVQSVLKDVDLFYLSVDADPPGVKLRGHLAMILGKERCRVIRYPVGYKDINDVMVGKGELPALGKKGVDDCLANASSVPIQGVIKASQVKDDLMKIRNDGFTPGLGCGVEEVDFLFTVKPKLIQFTTGVPGSGKSVWTRWWLVKMIQHNADLNLKWAMFTPENRPVAREYAKIAEALTGMTFSKGFPNSMSDEMIRKSLNFIEKHFFIISPDKLHYESFGGKVDGTKVNTLDAITRYLVYLKKTEDIFGYVIDAWNKIEHLQPKWQSETQFISEQLDKLIDFNDYWDVFGNVIVHPRKIEMVGENYKMPSLYDIKGSSAWKEKADYGVLIHRYKMRKMTSTRAVELGLDFGDLDEDEKFEVVPKAPTIIRTEKIRFEETGNENRVKMEMSTWGQFTIMNKKKAVEASPDDRIESLKIFDDDEDGEDTLPF